MVCEEVGQNPVQLALGLEDYVCTYHCVACKLCPGVCHPPDLTACPYPQCLCPANDWGLGDVIEYPEFFDWRLEHLTEDKKRLLMETGSDMMIITPDCLNQFYGEPEPVGQVCRCNRCLSIDIDWQPEWIVCKNCGWSEPLHDYPVARRYE